MDNPEVAAARQALADLEYNPGVDERGDPIIDLDNAIRCHAHGLAMATHLRALLLALDSGRENFRKAGAALLRRADDAAVSGAAMASRLAAGDPAAQRILVDSVEAIRHPVAALSRLFKAMGEPLSCGHPLDCLSEESGECGWCATMPPTEHPSDCQKCSEDADPCRTHAEDWRYWQARALDAEEAAADVDDTHDGAAKEGEK